MKPCRSCKTPFEPVRPLQIACSLPCALDIVQDKREKAARKLQRAQTREARQRLKPRSKWLKEAQAAFNLWIRRRDEKLPCISCNRHHHGQYHAGHYRSTGASPEIRFDEANVHKQCQPCNTHLSGNLVNYRAGLIAKIGLAEVERLEGPHPPQNWTINQLKEIKSRYKEKLCRQGT